MWFFVCSYIHIFTRSFFACRFIKPGTHIISDFWRSYLRIEQITERNFSHTRINHEEEFVNEDGYHTNNMEATWRVMKSKMPKRAYTAELLQSYIFEHMWRMHYLGSTWDAIIYALRVVKYNSSVPVANQGPFNIY